MTCRRLQKNLEPADLFQNCAFVETLQQSGSTLIQDKLHSSWKASSDDGSPIVGGAAGSGSGWMKDDGSVTGYAVEEGTIMEGLYNRSGSSGEFFT